MSTTTWVRWQCSQNISYVSKWKGLFGPNGGSGGKLEGGFGYVKESLRRGRRSGNKSSMGSKFMANGEECLDGWVGAGRGEVKGGGVNFRISKTLIGEIPREIIVKSGGEVFGVDGGAI
nr:hypothetical protein [Tanacetum cinerariifolium]